MPVKFVIADDIAIYVSGGQIGEELASDIDELATALIVIAGSDVDVSELACHVIENGVTGIASTMRDFCENLAREIRELEGTNQ